MFRLVLWFGYVVVGSGGTQKYEGVKNQPIVRKLQWIPVLFFISSGTFPIIFFFSGKWISLHFVLEIIMLVALK